MKTMLECPCGQLIEGKDEDDLVEQARKHLREAHPQLADSYTRDEILFLAS